MLPKGQALSWTDVQAFQGMWEDQKSHPSYYRTALNQKQYAVEHIWGHPQWEIQAHVEQKAWLTPGQPLGADVLHYLWRATFRNELQGIHLGKQNHVGLHLLTYHTQALDEPAGGMLTTWR